MSKIHKSTHAFILALMLSGNSFAKGVQVKKDQCAEIPSGFVCYSEKEADQIDVSQKEIFDCRLKLKECKAAQVQIQPQIQEPKTTFEKKWFRDTVLGVIVLSTGIMIGVAASD